jgi:hypothetical protein
MQRKYIKSRKSRILSTLRPEKKGDRRKCAYLYPCGTLVATFERAVDLGGHRTYLDYQKIGREVIPVHPPRSDQETSRVIFSEGSARILAGFDSVSWDCERVDRGSDKSKAAGVPVGSVTFYFGDRISDSFSVTTMNDFVSTHLHPQLMTAGFNGEIMEAMKGERPVPAEAFGDARDPVLFEYLPEIDVKTSAPAVAGT